MYKGQKRKKKKGNIACCEPYSDERWQIEEDLRAVARAAAVEKDPERMKKVKALAASKLDESKIRQEEADRMVALGEGKDV